MTSTTSTVSDKLEKIEQWLVKREAPAFRFRQLEKAWYSAKSWDEATSLPLEWRRELSAQFSWLAVSTSGVAGALGAPSDVSALGTPVNNAMFVSKKDGTTKALLTLADGLKIESVRLPNARGQATVCVSTQVGCAMNCSFCATGKMGWKRNLSVDEIVDQTRFWRFYDRSVRVTNVVLMGMGEPLANYDVVKEALEIMIRRMGISATRITLSTAGLSVGLDKLLVDRTFPPVRIALSLHAGTDAVRSQLMPSHSQTSMARLAAWAKKCVSVRANRRLHLTLEYLMIAGVNDSEMEAAAVARLFRDIRHRVKINLIPYNATGTAWRSTTPQNILRFQEWLTRAGFVTKIRISYGADIQAACGQLQSGQ